MKSDRSINKRAFERSPTLPRFREAIGGGAIGYLKDFGRRSVEVMRGRSLVLLRIQETIGEGDSAIALA